VRRPALTKAQRQHARQQRAFLRLRRAAVRHSLATDGELPELAVIEARTDLDAACDAFTGTLTARERRKLSR
jgi:hypothetical protein